MSRNTLGTKRRGGGEEGGGGGGRGGELGLWMYIYINRGEVFSSRVRLMRLPTISWCPTRPCAYMYAMGKILQGPTLGLHSRDLISSSLLPVISSHGSAYIHV